MERLLTGLVDFSIKKILSFKPTRLEVVYDKETLCPECGGLTRAMCTKPENLSLQKRQKLDSYFEHQPAIKNLWLYSNYLSSFTRS